MTLLVEQWRSLPQVYHIMDLPAAQSLVFLTVDSAQQWLIENEMPVTRFSITPMVVLYSPSRSDGKFRTTEEIVADRNKVLDEKIQG